MKLATMKIISLLPSATEIVYALGLGHCLQAVTAECDYPPEATAKTVVSRLSLPPLKGLAPAAIDRLVADSVARDAPLYVLDLPAIRDIEPDLILTQDLCRVCAVPSGQITQALEKLGCSCRIVSLDPHCLEEIICGIGEVGEAVGHSDQAQALTQELVGRIESVRSSAAGLPKLSAFALEWADPPYPGGHWIPEMIQIAGGHPLLNTPRVPSKAVSWSQVEDAAPEVIVFMPCGYSLKEAAAQADDLLKIPEFASTPAAKQGRVFITDGSAYFSRPGPRIVDGLEILAWAIHPAAFPYPGDSRIMRAQPGLAPTHPL